MLNTESFLLGMVAGGNGNPNYVETVTGTLQNLALPSGTMAAIGNYNATGYVRIDGTAIGAGVEILPLIINAAGTQMRATAATIDSGGVSTGAYVSWESNGTVLVSAWLYTPGTGAVDVSAYPLPCTTTIIHHPQP